MTKERYETLKVAQIREFAKSRGIKGASSMKKAELIEAMVLKDEQERAMELARNTGMPMLVFEEAPAKPAEEKREKPAEKKAEKPAGEERAKPAGEKREKPAEKKSEKPAKEERAKPAGEKREKPAEKKRRKPAKEEHAKAAEEKPVKTEEPAPAEAQKPAEEEKPAPKPVQAEKAPEAAKPAAEAPRAEEAKAPSDQAPIPSKAARGVLEIMTDGYGFLRSAANYLSGEEDVYVSPSQIRRFNLRTGDLITGFRRDRGPGEKYGGLLYVGTVNGKRADDARKRFTFEKMTPIFPDERIRLEHPGGSRAIRIVDLISPIGKGQRGMIVSPPKAGKTTLLKDIAKSILAINPKANLIILLIDERPEEVTDMIESVTGENVEVVYSTFDEQPDHHRRVSEMVLERAKRMVELKQDVVILLDSITRLARAYNVLVPPSGRTLSGGIDPTALYAPKRFFGAARNMREGGSLTILATALVDTGSKMDDVIYEEFKGTGNMELILDRKLQERRVFPAIDIVRSGTRREDLLLDEKEQRAVYLIRRRLNGLKPEDSVETLLNAFAKYETNEEVADAIIAGWGH